ncbi:DHH family phosphoesterase [Paenibacillus koleovorans]|uniref:DHH family phosphoesterase n=1 Tax=Paenibacillus koleovorans TaxID=121608 RepID=UPI000FDB368C|nr:DHH family phosphoesterase [Paenibacillus koleovorans]
MPKFLTDRWHSLPMYGAMGLILLLSGMLMYYEWILGVVGLLLGGGLLFYMIRAERAFQEEMNEYTAKLSHRVKKAGNEVFNEFPIGIVLYDEERDIQWNNPFMAQLLRQDSLNGEHLFELFPALKGKIDKDGRLELTIGKQIYQVTVKAEHRLLYFQDVTALSALTRRFEEEKIAIGVVLLDNLDEATQGMDDQSRSLTLAKTTGELTSWAQKYGLFMRRTASDRLLVVMNNKSLRQLEQSRFDILDDVRDATIENKVPMTLSIGIGAAADSLVELGQLAQTSLDMALGRGGDQVAVKVGQRLSFYGGRSNAVEKRTRVRARVISHAMRDLMRDSDKVVIMGHRHPDMDAIGAAIGVLKAVQMSQKEGYIVLEGINPSIMKLMETIKGDERLYKWFITPEQALQITTPRSLAIVVDTHKASMVAEPKLLQQTQRIMVIDHHRRSEEFINEATLIYMEPYASSTCELVTELLQYFQERVSLEVLEATVLLAGIVVDTKSFALRTGARTFEAASFLRRNGADSGLIQRMLKEDLDAFIRKAEVIKHAEILYEHIAVAVTQSGRKYPQLLIAQAADTLINMTDIMASFVVSERTDGLIGISARSLGQINVQVVMERLGGGGHLTNAAVQLEGKVEDAVKKLKEVLAQMKDEEGLFE